MECEPVGGLKPGRREHLEHDGSAMIVRRC